MDRLIAHAGVEHATELEAAAHNRAPVLFLVSGLAVVAGIVIYWLLTRSETINHKEEETKE